MSIGRQQVLHAARLAEIAVDEAELDRLVEQLGRIVDYVAQLDEVPAGETAESYAAGPPQVRLRDDVVDPVPLVHPLSAMAPEFVQGFFLVPRRGTMEEGA